MVSNRADGGVSMSKGADLPGLLETGDARSVEGSEDSDASAVVLQVHQSSLYEPKESRVSVGESRIRRGRVD